jgi:clan AA aspartic protease (TIGR02281 family)
MLNTNIRRPQLEQVLKYLKPIMPYLSEYLKNIAIYDSNNQCCLYFDEQSINYLLKNGNINQSESDRLKQNAEIFKTYNDYKIQLKYENGHYYAIVVVIGKNASTEVMMMLDTGATKSMISEDVALKTGSETLSSEQMMYFQTANGLVKYPLVKRRLVLEDTGKDLEISVNTKDNINLLGMDFLKDCSIDSQERCIYVKIKAEE